MNISIKTLASEEFDAFESSIDTNYFGILSAKAILTKPCADQQKQEELLAFLHQFEFVIITNKNSDPLNNCWIGEKTNAFLVDTNIRLRKQLTALQTIPGDSPTHIKTTIADQQPRNDQVVHIAETYFKLSQFLNDPYLPHDKGSRIYGDIVQNAFGQPGRYFVLTTIDDVVAGFLLFAIQPAASSATIQLIAVNQDFKRQGIGQTLIRSMENYVFHQEIRTVYVGTQFNNFDALKFYMAGGYSYFECSTIFHYWPGRP
jgi:ribosomal protein S18 acetylase RimI-like enzyme